VNLADIRAALATRLATVTELRIYEHVPDTVEPPCAIVSLGNGDYTTDLSGGGNVNWTVQLLVSRAGGDVRAQQKLDGYLSTDTAESIFAAVHGDTELDDTIDSAEVQSWTAPGNYVFGETAYVGVEIQVETLT
jgi:hypothetical protein